MKSTIKTTFVFASLLVSAVAAHAESLTVKVPFSFSVPGKELPAGEYAIKTMEGSPGVLSIQGAGAKVLVFTRTIPVKMPEKTTVTFKEKALVGISLAGRAYELNESSGIAAPMLTAAK